MIYLSCIFIKLYSSFAAIHDIFNIKIYKIYSIYNWLTWALLLSSVLPDLLFQITVTHRVTWYIYTSAYIYHITPLCNRLSKRFQWFSMSGLLFILFGFLHQPVCYIDKPTDVSPLIEFNAARSTLSDHYHPPYHMIHIYICIHVPYTIAPWQVTWEVSVVQHEWPSFYTLWFLPSIGL